MLLVDESDEDDTEYDATDFSVYNALVKEFSDFFRKAANARCCIVLPPNEGLPRMLTLNFLEYHVLKPSPLFKGQYITWKNKEAAIENRDNKFLITIGAGWKYSCKAKILHKDVFYTSNNTPYTVFYVSRHLLSGADQLHGISSDKAHPDRLRLPNNMLEMNDLINKLNIPEYIDSECHAFLRSYVLVPGCRDDASAKVQQLFSRCSEITTEKTISTIQPTAKNTEVLYIATTTHIMDKLHTMMWPYWVHENKTAEQHLYQTAKIIQKCKTLKDMAEEPFTSLPESTLKPAIQEIEQLPDSHTPLGKMQCIKRCLDKIGEMAPEEKRKELSADSILPVLAYVLAVCEVPFLSSHCEYIASFAADSLFQSENGYAHISFQAALTMIQQEGGEMLRDYDGDIDLGPCGDLLSSLSLSFGRKPPSASSPSTSASSSPKKREPPGSLRRTSIRTKPASSSPSTSSPPPQEQPPPAARRYYAKHISTTTAKSTGDFLQGLL
eukprot:TRINITY_DN8065_c0_g7_i1.p1 TRINITY_DN8065_c0_g7~~TRINITY_DN8065_c0_g7_i1.p1  ORF type:complete len:496 (+),score=136.37 TRINITY_DN8065_c0_g7_i1:136-1623(+)